MIRASSSAVRSDDEEMRQCCSMRSRSNIPIVVWVLPTSTASSIGSVHLQAEIDRRSRMRERADGYRIDARPGDVADRFERNSAGRLRLRAALRERHCFRERLEIHVVEEQ